MEVRPACGMAAAMEGSIETKKLFTATEAANLNSVVDRLVPEQHDSNQKVPEVAEVKTKNSLFS